MGDGFDEEGAQSGSEGNVLDWWIENCLSEFGAHGKALVDEYNGYAVFNDLNVNCKLTLGKNIGDLSGVTIAYKT